LHCEILWKILSLIVITSKEVRTFEVKIKVSIKIQIIPKNNPWSYIVKWGVSLVEIEIKKNNKEKYMQLDRVIERYKQQEGMLIRILQKAQEIFGHLPIEVQSYVSDRLDIPISTVNGVVSFYSLFSEEPQGKYTINVCMGTACYVKGSQEILKTIEEELHIREGETTLDKLFTIKVTRCIGACGLAPVITINEKVYGRLSPSDIPGILHTYIKTNKKAAIGEEVKA